MKRHKTSSSFTKKGGSFLQEIEECLKAFNELVEEISKYKFFKKKRVCFIIFFGKPNKNKVIGPSKEDLSAFVLHYRKIIQDKDDISIKNMGIFYKQAPIEKIYYERYKLIIKNIDEIFSKPTNITTDNHTYTIREIHNMFIQGNLAHIQRNHYNRKLYLEITKDPVKETIFKTDLVITLLKIMRQLIAIKKLNEEVLEKIKKYNME